MLSVQASAILFIIATWSVLVFVVVGVGLMVAGRPGVGDQSDFFDAWWLGLCVSIAGLQLWHLVLPVDWRAAGALALVGSIGTARCLGRAGGWSARFRSLPRGCLVVMAGFVVWMANRATGPGDYGDSGCYHIAGIRWANEHAIVPGLANLLDTLGLNNSSFLLHAACETGFWHGRSNHLVNPLVLTMLGMQSIRGLWRCWRSRPNPGVADLFTATLFPAFVAAAVGREVSSPTTDMIAGVLSIVGWIPLLRLARERPESSADACGPGVLVAACAAAAVCLKVSAVVTGGLSLLCLACLLVRRRVGWARVAAVVMLPPLLLLGPWCIRGVILSGYPLFPSTAFAVPVDWRLDEHALGSIRNFATNSGMLWWMPVPELPMNHRVGMSWGWLGQWAWKGMVREPLLIAAPLLVTVVLAGLVAVSRGSFPSRERKAAWLATALPLVAGFVFWFITCPAPRMGSWILWASAGWMAAAAGAGRALEGGTRRRGFVVCLVGLALVAIGHRTATWVHYHRSTGRPAAINPFLRSVWIPPGPDHGLHPYPTADLVSRTNRWGVTVSMPRVRSETWWAPLPATYNDITNLRLRRPGDLAHGFFTDAGPSPPAANAFPAEEAVTP